MLHINIYLLFKYLKKEFKFNFVKTYETPYIIDTDIGTDFDDTLALYYALNLENLEILGITTNYGPISLSSFSFSSSLL